MDLLIGLDPLGLVRCIIDCEDKKLNFKKTITNRNVTAAETAKIPPNPRTIVDTKTESICTIMTLPTHWNKNLLVANTISEVKVGITQVMVCNTSDQEITLNKNDHICNYEEKNDFRQPIKLNHNTDESHKKYK